TPDGQTAKIVNQAKLLTYDVPSGSVVNVDPLADIAGSEEVFSPDARYLMFHRDAGKHVVYDTVLHVDRCILNSPLFNAGFYPAMSSDNAFVCCRDSGNGQIVTSDAATGTTLKTMSTPTPAPWTRVTNDSQFFVSAGSHQFMSLLNPLTGASIA